MDAVDVAGVERVEGTVDVVDAVDVAGVERVESTMDVVDAVDVADIERVEGRVDAEVAVAILTAMYVTDKMVIVVLNSFAMEVTATLILDKVIWTASICLPGTHQLEQGPWQH